ncbi:ABC transporter ATP-binding protein [Mangrovicoccus sp. HB161399]|uniref:ABC transporter ATP-binding protein n=1 Tax=Mangrovicoccus sp. HB161399 TaxID=2720392 RepID=UPI0015549654|nr:oligopeptide/dipeptide ABC transporter ATP-binding protein [Mangrovicoccus sp. HB161399]
MTGSLLRVRDLSVAFPVKGGGLFPWRGKRMLRAVQGAGFDLAAGKTLGIVGESGSGKSTLARAILGLVPRAGGEVLWDGKPLGEEQRPEVQMIFQDPLAALNPRMTVGEIIAEPLLTHRPEMRKAERTEKVVALMERVGLRAELRNRYPHEFSGGQCQRIGIARALISGPRLVLCDEPVSALDVSVQAQVVNLLKELQAEMGLSLIFIAHDLSVVRHISDEIMVMYLGRVMERAPAAALVERPMHPYTRALIASAPIPDPVVEKARPRAVLEGELPSPMSPPSGCVFRTRCPLAQPSCAGDVPALERIGPDRRLACPVVERQAEAPPAFGVTGG